MKAAVLVKPGEISILRKPAYPPQPGEVEVAPSYVAICGSDQARYAGRLQCDSSVAFGHEFSGRVTGLGSGVSGLEPGQLVTVAPLLNCGVCHFCKTGREYLCSARQRLGTDIDGALRERVCVPASRVFALPSSVSLREAALVEPLAVAVHATRQVVALQGARVAVLGAGAIGLLIAQVARSQGAHNPVLVDISRPRLRLAEALGFAVVDASLADPIAPVLAHTNGGGANVLFEATGSAAAGRYFLPLLAVGGTIVVVGRIEEPVPLSLDSLLLKEARLLTSRYFGLADFQTALDLLAAGRVATTPLIQATMTFDQLSEGQGQVVMGAARQVVRLLIELNSQIPEATSGRPAMG